MPNEGKRDEGHVVSGRPAEAGGETRAGRSPDVGGAVLWQALAPLLVGFAMLVGLVFGLGYQSDKRVSQIRFDTQREERTLASHRNTLLNLHLALNKLNTEARIRGRLEAAGVLLPPTDLRLRNERAGVRDLLPDFDRIPATEPARRADLRSRLNNFIELTGDLRRYSLEGFEAHKEIEEGIEVLSRDLDEQRYRHDEQRDASIEEVRKEIRFLMWLAALTGLVVATATTLEVWRRFRQMRRGYEALRRERQYSAQMIEGMPSAVAALDRRDHIRSANAAFFEVFPGARVGASIHDKFTTPEGLALLAAATASHVGRTTYRGRWRMGADAAGRDPRTFDIYSSPLEFEGEPGQLLTLVDVTEAAEAEQVLRRQEALAAVGQAAAQVAHEIKNPLGSIRLGVAMLRDMTDNREAITTIDLVERGIEHLSKLTLDVTQFSRRRQLNLAETDLTALLDESLDLVSGKLREKQTPVERHYAAEALRGLWDEDQLRQVFVNLLANAVDASPAGAPVEVTAETARVPGGARRDGEGGQRVAGARVHIVDRGPGMDEQTRARIFEPFFTTKKKGTGLGLAIAKQIVEQHGGTIRAVCAPGEGTRITIELPLAASAA